MTDERMDRSSGDTSDVSGGPGTPLPEESGSAGSDERSGDPGTDGSDATLTGAPPAFEPDQGGNDNIREGQVGGLMGGPNQQQGQGQGG